VIRLSQQAAENQTEKTTTEKQQTSVNQESYRSAAGATTQGIPSSTLRENNRVHPVIKHVNLSAVTDKKLRDLLFYNAELLNPWVRTSPSKKDADQARGQTEDPGIDQANPPLSAIVENSSRHLRMGLAEAKREQFNPTKEWNASVTSAGVKKIKAKASMVQFFCCAFPS
jgi:hypothetical protein